MEAKKAPTFESNEHTQTYAKRCGTACKEYDIPFDVMLAISPDHAEEFCRQYEFLKEHTQRYGRPPELTIKGLQGYNPFNPKRLDLYAMKDTLLALLEPSTELRVYIEGLGFQHTKRIADYILLLW